MKMNLLNYIAVPEGYRAISGTRSWASGTPLDQIAAELGRPLWKIVARGHPNVPRMTLAGIMSFIAPCPIKVINPHKSTQVGYIAGENMVLMNAVFMPDGDSTQLECLLVKTTYAKLRRDFDEAIPVIPESWNLVEFVEDKLN